MVDEHTGQLLADRAVDEQRRHGAVDPARERAEDALAADLLPDRARAAVRSRPRASSEGWAPATMEEVAEHRRPVRGVDDLGMELDAVEPPGRVLEGGDRRSSPSAR